VPLIKDLFPSSQQFPSRFSNGHAREIGLVLTQIGFYLSVVMLDQVPQQPRNSLRDQYFSVAFELVNVFES
jgi:hypothetical protein